jgi:hypothetical protein
MAIGHNEIKDAEKSSVQLLYYVSVCLIGPLKAQSIFLTGVGSVSVQYRIVGLD